MEEIDYSSPKVGGGGGNSGLASLVQVWGDRSLSAWILIDSTDQDFGEIAYSERELQPYRILLGEKMLFLNQNICII